MSVIEIFLLLIIAAGLPTGGLYLLKNYPEQVNYYLDRPETWMITLAFLAVSLWFAYQASLKAKARKAQDMAEVQAEFSPREFEVARVLAKDEGYMWDCVGTDPYVGRRFLEKARRVLEVA
jgi:hypothetical protein